MPSILSCFCVKHSRRMLIQRKRGSRKNILNLNSEWNSDASSDLCIKAEHEPYTDRPQRFTQFGNKAKEQDAEILSRLMDNQSPRRRRHVEDIFRQDSTSDSSKPYVYRDTSAPSGQSSESMYGYVPKAVGAMSASTALTGVKYDDFFSDRRMHPDLNKFAKSTDLSNHYNDFYAVNNHNEKRRPSIVNLGTSDSVYFAAPAQVQIEMEPENACFDDVRAGSESFASPSPVSSDPVQHSFLLGYGESTSQPSMTPYHMRIERMFQCDGDILY